MKSLLRVAGALAIAVPVVLANGTAWAAPLSKDAAKCQSGIGKALTGYTSGVLKAWQGYLNAEMKAPGSGDVAKRDAALAAAVTKADAAITKACPTDDILFDPAPAGVGMPQHCHFENVIGGPAPEEAYETACYNQPVTNRSQYASCVRCWFLGEIWENLKLAYPCVQGLVPTGSTLDCGTAPSCTLPPSAADAKCLSTIAKNALKEKLALLKIWLKCLNGYNNGKIADCGADQKTLDAIAKNTAKTTAAIGKACLALPPWWDTCPEAEPCGGPITNPAGIGTCVNNAETGMGVELTCMAYTKATEGGVPCEGAPTCCPATRIVTNAGTGVLQVSTLAPFPFPAGVLTTVDAGAPNGCCRHDVTIPPGGFSVPVFCIPALGFTSQVTTLGCEEGTAEGNGHVWDASAGGLEVCCADADVSRVGDTSQEPCGTLGAGCTLPVDPGEAGDDTDGNIDTTRGNGACDPAGVHTQLDIPVHSLTWNDADGNCPDDDGVYSPGTDTLVTDFNFILSPTTATSNADYTDLNGDGCSFEGNGPDHVKHCSLNLTRPCATNGHCTNPPPNDGTCVDGPLTGVPPAGPCCVVGQTTTVVASGIAFTGGAPLYDLIFANQVPATITSCGSPGSDTCTLNTNPCLD